MSTRGLSINFVVKTCLFSVLLLKFPCESLSHKFQKRRKCTKLVSMLFPGVLLHHCMTLGKTITGPAEPVGQTRQLPY